MFVTNPSYAGPVPRAAAGAADEDDGLEDETPAELCVLEGARDVFRVPLAWSGRECVDPYMGARFKAPSFAARRAQRLRARRAANPELHANAAATTSASYARKRSSLHNTVSLQSGGAAKPNSPRADCTIARTTLTYTQLDDGAPKRVRIILERSRFERSTGGARAEGMMRLMVYVSDLNDSNQLHTAVINMEINLAELFPHLKDGSMFAGFTASTGRLFESHAISRWTYHEGRPH
ncbi:hypothetical protein T492DRAFT_988772 [Pavlovales sp. CCMP2436]|nr:hypothetical protein T492DRAFT_988772 [Pavlovales sp. CCMP2436]